MEAYGIKIQLPGDNKILTLCEVQFFSPNKPDEYHLFVPNTPAPGDAWQSSGDNGGEAARAVDGEPTKDRWNVGGVNSCIETDNQRDPWWKYSLGAQAENISKIRITNRNESNKWNLLNGENINGGDNAQGFNVYLCPVEMSTDYCGTNDDDWVLVTQNGLEHSTFLVPDGEQVEVRFAAHLTTRDAYGIKIELPGPGRILTICEVEVMVLDEKCPTDFAVVTQSFLFSLGTGGRRLSRFSNAAGRRLETPSGATLMADEAVIHYIKAMLVEALNGMMVDGGQITASQITITGITVTETDGNVDLKVTYTVTGPTEQVNEVADIAKEQPEALANALQNVATAASTDVSNDGTNTVDNGGSPLEQYGLTVTSVSDINSEGVKTKPDPATPMPLNTIAEEIIEKES